MEREFLKPLPALRSHLSRAVFTQAEGFRQRLQKNSARKIWVIIIKEVVPKPHLGKF